MVVPAFTRGMPTGVGDLDGEGHEHEAPTTATGCLMSVKIKIFGRPAPEILGFN